MDDNTAFHSALQLSREYFFAVAEPRLKPEFPELYPRLAAGLAGNGSECFGYDDEISRDHDWGVDFFIWVPECDKELIPMLSDWKDCLFNNVPPQFTRTRTEYGARIGVMTCGNFYYGLIGASEGPHTYGEWLRAPEENFAMSVNGEVFYDGAGEFTRTREYLLGYYPEDIRRKRIASHCMALAQTGQYNHERIAKRGDQVTLRSVLSRFTDSAIAMAFLLNKVYRPYYKWAYRALGTLPLIGSETSRLLQCITENGGFDGDALSLRQRYIEELCMLFIHEIKVQGLSGSDDHFLAAHGEEVMRGIHDEALRSLPPQHLI